MAASANIYEYDDFKAYLARRYQEKCAADPAYSCRVFAKEAGFTNPGFLNDVIKGRRKLSADAREKIVTVFALSVNEADFFRLLVAYAQEKEATKKQAIFHKLVVRRNRSMFARLNPALSHYYQDFYYPLVRAALMALDFKGNYEELAAFLSPSPPLADCKKYVRDLCAWGLVKQETSGRYVVTDRFLEPPATLKEQVRQINGTWIAHAQAALAKLPPEKRHISSMLLSVSPESARIIAEKVEKFREEIWDLVKNDPQAPACVMQLNMQYFPRSKQRERS
ncbi:MAG: TIGR02147 family protein [Chitinivibrionales bacterium]|nr:TIGR02147 family protein [Chitinivibrionales bacterium]